MNYVKTELERFKGLIMLYKTQFFSKDKWQKGYKIYNDPFKEDIRDGSSLLKILTEVFTFVINDLEIQHL